MKKTLEFMRQGRVICAKNIISYKNKFDLNKFEFVATNVIQLKQNNC